MKKRLLASVVAGIFALSLVACGENVQDQATSEPLTEDVQEKQDEAVQSPADSTEANAGLANPWKEITEEEAMGLLVNPISAPAGAQNVRWSMMNESDGSTAVPGPLVQLDFELDGLEFTAREQCTGDDNPDISGMYYDWTVSDDVTLANWAEGYMPAKTYRYAGENEFADLCTWYDFETGYTYSLSVVAPDLAGFDIQAIAEAMCDPSKQEYSMIPDEEEEEHIPVDYTGCDTFTQIVDKLAPGQGYANATIVNRDVLLVSTFTYDFDGNDDGKNIVSIDADVFAYGDDGSIQYLGYVTSNGTSYPLATDGKYLYAGGNHGMAKMTIDTDDKIAVDEEVYVIYDTDGNGTYYHTSDVAVVEQDPEGKVEDDSLFNLFFQNYEEAERIEFTTVE